MDTSSRIDINVDIDTVFLNVYIELYVLFADILYERTVSVNVENADYRKQRYFSDYRKFSAACRFAVCKSYLAVFLSVDNLSEHIRESLIETESSILYLISYALIAVCVAYRISDESEERYLCKEYVAALPRRIVTSAQKKLSVAFYIGSNIRV